MGKTEPRPSLLQLSCLDFTCFGFGLSVGRTRNAAFLKYEGSFRIRTTAQPKWNPPRTCSLVRASIENF